MTDLKTRIVRVQLEEFAKIRDAYFDASSEDAIEVILADKKKTLDVRNEDAEFIRRLRRNEYVRFGSRDWNLHKLFARTAAREEKEQERVAKEAHRKEVGYR